MFCSICILYYLLTGPAGRQNGNGTGQIIRDEERKSIFERHKAAYRCKEGISGKIVMFHKIIHIIIIHIVISLVPISGVLCVNINLLDICFCDLGLIRVLSRHCVKLEFFCTTLHILIYRKHHLKHVKT